MAPHPMFRLQRRMLRRLLRELAEQAGPEDHDIATLGRRYLRTLLRLSRRPLRPEPRQELIKAAAGHALVFVGDQHVLPRLQIEAARLLDDLCADGRPVTLALELLPATCQAEAERFTDGTEPAERFLRRLRHRVRWPFPLQGYCALLERARARSLRILALDAPRDHGRSLLDREELMASRLAAELRARPGPTIVTLVGEFHLAPGGLPDRALGQLREHGIAASALRVHQNPEPLEWRLATASAPAGSVLRLAPDQWALHNAHPLVRVDATLRHVLEQSGMAGSRDPADRMAWLLQDLTDYLGLGAQQLPPFELITPEGEEAVSLLRGRGVPLARATLCARELRAFGSAVLPERHCILLASEHVNHWSEAAARYLHGRWHQDHWDAPVERRFAHDVLSHAAGFLGSALYNPHRMPLGLIALLERAQERRPLKPVVRAARGLLRAWRRAASTGSERRVLVRALVGTSPLVAAVAARCLGHALGQRLAEAHIGGTLAVAQLRRLLLETADVRRLVS